METSEKFQNIPIFTQYTQTKNNTGLEEFYFNFGKRGFDLFLAIICLPFVLPVLLVSFILIKCSSKGPAIYRSKRMGKNGKIFDCLKLRTMYLNADKELERILERDKNLESEYKTFWKLKHDPRITPVGKFLRRFSLDELPQIFNVFKNEMSLVGPRPAFQEELAQYGSSINNYYKSRPGITGLWQVNGRSDSSFKSRIRLDTEYSQKCNFSLDLKIILKTIPVALSKKGAY